MTALPHGLCEDEKPAAIVRERAQRIDREKTMQNQSTPDSVLPASFKVSHADRVIDKDSGDFFVYSKTTKHTMNRLVREGRAVFTLD